MGDEERSYDQFEEEDFGLLAAAAADDRCRFIARNPHHAGLQDRVLVVALCQGAALHHVDGENGVKDFDVWSFYAPDNGSPRFPPRRIGYAEYMGDRFQASTRRIDLLGRTLDQSDEADPVKRFQEYLGARRSSSAYHLTQKAAVILEPVERRGEIAWPLSARRTSEDDLPA